MTTYLILLQTILLLFISDIYHPQDYKTDTGYIIQELGINTAYDHYQRFTGLNAILSEHREFYTLSEEKLQKCISADNIELDKLLMIVEPHPSIRTLSRANEYEPLTLNYSSGILNFLTLDDTGVYLIGGKYYVIRNIKYKYIDGINLRYSDPNDELLKEFRSKDLRLFLYTIELLPTSKSIQKHIWKKKYEFCDFWSECVKNQMKVK